MLASSMEDFLSWAHHGAWPANTCLIDFSLLSPGLPSLHASDIFDQVFLCCGRIDWCIVESVASLVSMHLMSVMPTFSDAKVKKVPGYHCMSCDDQIH